MEKSRQLVGVVMRGLKQCKEAEYDVKLPKSTQNQRENSPTRQGYFLVAVVIELCLGMIAIEPLSHNTCNITASFRFRKDL